MSLPGAPDVAERVLRPLLLGGELRPLRPIGARRALQIADAESFLLDAELAAARLRQARRLWPIDQLPEPTPGEWLLLSALNDLLQVNHADLVAPYARHRPARLLSMVFDCIRAAGAPRTALDALARHASFSAVLALERTDTLVSWWTGQRWFIGVPVPARLLAWPRLRRVRKQTRRLRVFDMAGNAAWANSYRDAVSAWLSATPITELLHGALGERGLQLAATPAGRTLAGRALERAGRLEGVLRSARDAADRLTGDGGAAAAELTQELEQRVARMRA
jgi:hypothetical protein